MGERGVQVLRLPRPAERLERLHLAPDALESPLEALERTLARPKTNVGVGHPPDEGFALEVLRLTNKAAESGDESFAVAATAAPEDFSPVATTLPSCGQGLAERRPP